MGSHALWIAWPDLQQRGLAQYFDELPRYSLAQEVGDADFILVSGVGSLFAGTPNALKMKFERDGNPVPFGKTFRVAIARSLPMVCANPDLEVVRPGGWKANLPGALAKQYENLGGRVIFFGKPYTAAFEEARRLLEETGVGKRICHVGDSLLHDVAGASNVGLDAAFVVQTGIHAEHLPELPSVNDIAKLCKKERVPLPAVVIPRFTW
uniref:Uncharacterized protein n=1 Tax=Pyrodinium bahamense TaxID=73915 RepID=A0A7S0AKY5_9DINO